MDLMPLAARFVGLGALAVAATAAADDFEIANPDQDAFADAAEDLSAALNYKALGPAEATGATGFSIGAFGSYVPVQNEDSWETLTGEEVSEIGMVGLSVAKGLPLGLDVGAFYATIPGAGADLFGAELRYAILKGGVASPALAIRASYSALSGAEDIEYDSAGVDVSISKGFAFIAPYAGAGMLFSTVEADDRFGLDKEEIDTGRFFVGARMSLGFLSLTPEYERIGDSDAFNLRLSLGL